MVRKRVSAEEQIRRLNRVHRVSSGINQAIVRVREPQALFERACHIAVDQGGFRMAWIGLLDDATGEVRVVAHAGIAADYLEKLRIVLRDEPRGHGPTALALRTGQHAIANDIAQDPRMTPWREDALRLGYRASAAFPLTCGGRTLGALNLYATEPGFFDADEVVLLDGLATDIGFAMEFAEQDSERRQAAEALKKSQRLLAETERVGKVGGWEFDVDTRRQTWTEEVYNIHEVDLTYKPTVEVGVNFYTPASRPIIERAVQGAIERGEPFDVELEIVTAKGNLRSIQAIGRTDPEHRRIYGFFQDITARKRMESVMKARLRLVECAASHSLDELLTATLDEVEAITGSQIGFYHFLAADQRMIDLHAWSTRTLRELCTAEGNDDRHYDIDRAGVWADCVRERRPVIHNDYAALPNKKDLPTGHAPVTRELVVPIFRENQIVAILGVGNKPADYGAEDVKVVSDFADLAWDIAARKRAETYVSEQLEELRRWQAMMLDRSDRSQELKREINELCRRLGEPARYPSQASPGS